MKGNHLFEVLYLFRVNLDRNGKLEYVWDSLWLVIVSMLTSKWLHLIFNSWIWRHINFRKCKSNSFHTCNNLGHTHLFIFHCVNERSHYPYWGWTRSIWSNCQGWEKVRIVSTSWIGYIQLLNLSSKSKEKTKVSEDNKI